MTMEKSNGKGVRRLGIPSYVSRFQAIATVIAFIVLLATVPLMTMKPGTQGLHVLQQVTSRYSRHSDVICQAANEACGFAPRRCTPMDMSKRWGFIHISKCAGTSWMTELLKIIPKLEPPRASGGGVEWHAAWARKNRPTDYLLVSLKSPRHHAWSVFSNCKYAPYWRDKITRGTGFPRSGNEPQNDEDDFGVWATHIAKNWPKPPADSYNCFDPSNFQSHFLTAETSQYTGPRHPWPTTPDFSAVNESYWGFDFVGLGEFYHESKCLLFYRIQLWIELYTYQYNKTGFHFNGTNQATYDKASLAFTEIQSYLETCVCPIPTNLTGKTADEHIVHIARGKRASLRTLPDQALNTVEKFTSRDAELYHMALGQFMKEINWLEVQLGRRILCDSSLDRWEEELQYILGDERLRGGLYQNKVEMWMDSMHR